MKRQMKTLKSLLLLAGLYVCLTAQAAVVDTLAVPSAAMNKAVKVVTVRPDKAVKGDKCPVVYLLHGHGGHENTWFVVKPELAEIADREGIIFVCPNGENSWYWDSPVNPALKFETFVSKELVEYVDSHFATLADREHRAITGLSMGGHGAMWNAIRHQDVFGACGSMSGGLDIRPFPDNWHMKDHLGERDTNLEVWNNHTVINQLDKLKDGMLAITIDCGFSDFFADVNRAVHQALLSRKIGHDYTMRPGGHTRDYWDNSFDYHILFFKKYFEKNK